MISLVFEGNLQKMIDGEKPYISRPLIVGKPSVILIQCGADAEHSITITRRVIDKAMRHEVRDTNGKMIGNTGHGLTKKLIVSAIRELENPTMVFKGRKKGSILVITNTKDQKNRNIVIAIEFNRM